MWDFLRGVASILDIGGTLRDPRVDRILETTDAEALESDWKAIGDDMRRALQRVETLRAWTANEEPRF